MACDLVDSQTVFALEGSALVLKEVKSARGTNKKKEGSTLVGGFDVSWRVRLWYEHKDCSTLEASTFMNKQTR